MPLKEYVVLNNHKNAFPIHVYYGKGKNIFNIVLNGFDTIDIDVTKHYEKVLEEYKDDTSSFVYHNADNILNNNKFSEGDVVSDTSAWGIWSLKSDTIEGKNCIVAEHGIQSLEGGKDDILGTVNVYFNYDDSGKIQVLNMEFVSAETEIP